MSTLVRVADLVKDLDIYPRTRVSSKNVANLVAALEGGHQLPPLEADELSLRIIDGFHRCEAYLKVFGPDHEVEVNLRHYESDTEMLLASINANSTHGQQLHEIEKRRLVLRLRDAGTDDDTIGFVLRIPPPKIEKITLHTASVQIGGGGFRLEALKKPHFHFAGREMTEPQARAARSAPGVPYSLVIRQLRDGLRERLIDQNDGRLMLHLGALAEEINAYLAEVQQAG